MKQWRLCFIWGSHSSVTEVFWDVTLCQWVTLGLLDPEDEGGLIHPDIRYFSPNNTTWHHTRILNLHQKSAREREVERNVEIYVTISSLIHTVCLNVNVVKSRSMRLAGQYKMVLSWLVHNLYTAQVCTQDTSCPDCGLFCSVTPDKCQNSISVRPSSLPWKLEDCRSSQQHCRTLKSSRVMLRHRIGSSSCLKGTMILWNGQTLCPSRTA
jgi:hypothetical protein